MGNETVGKQATRYRNRTLEPKDYRQNYSIQVSSRQRSGLNSFINEIKPPSSQRSRKKSFDIGANDDSILKYLMDSKQTPQVSGRVKNQGFQKGQFLTADYDSINVQKNNPKTRKQKDRILQNLSRKNQQLRKQLKLINQQLTQKLKRKKFLPKKKKESQEEDQENTQFKKQTEAKTAGLRRQLQNGYKQIDMYKRTLVQLKAKQQTAISTIKFNQMQNQISQLDRIINQTMKKMDGMKNIKKNQEKNIETDINLDLIDNLQVLKKQLEEIKYKIKEFNKRDSQRENNYKRQQAYQFEVEKKYRSLSGQYFPQLKKKVENQQHSNNKKPSTFDKYSSQNKKATQQQQYPSVYQVQAATKQLTQLRSKHEQYHKKIDNQLQQKNKVNEQLQKLDQQVASKDKIIQDLKKKLALLRKIIRPNKKGLFGYDGYENSQMHSQYGMEDADKQIEQEQQQDQFDIKHLIANIPKPIRVKPVQMQGNNSIRSGASGNKPAGDKCMIVTGQKSQPKVWGTSQTRKQEKGKNYKNQLSFDDSVQFQSTEIQPLIIGVNVWVNKNNDVLAIQAIYLNKEEIRYGVKSSSSADGFIVRYDLQAPDYLKNITGGLNNDSGVLQYVAFYSKKGKSATFGNKRQNQQNISFGLSSNQRPFRFNGSTIMIESQPRICRIGIQICIQ